MFKAMLLVYLAFALPNHCVHFYSLLLERHSGTSFSMSRVFGRTKLKEKYFKLYLSKVLSARANAMAMQLMGRNERSTRCMRVCVA
jgi:hypothetical protein